jgi:hypothetical protein
MPRGSRAVKFPGFGAGDFYFSEFLGSKTPKIKNVGKRLNIIIPADKSTLTIL